MPVDPATLPGYRPPDPTPAPRRTWARAALILFGGSAFFGLFFAIAKGDPALTRAYSAVYFTALGIFFLARAHLGYQEDGLLGAADYLRRPFGSFLMGDDVVRTNRYSVAVSLVMALGAILAGVLMV